MGLFDRLLGRKKPSPAPEPAAPAPPSPPPSEPDSPLERFLQADAIPDMAAIESAVASLDSAGRALHAIDALRRIAAAHGDSPALARLTARLLLGRGDDDAASPLLERAATDPRFAADSLFRLAEVHERAGRAARALECYERVLARDLDFPNARERAVRLGREARPAAVAAAPTLFSPEGTKIQGRFRLQRELGRGGAAAVYLAQDVRLGRAIALKVYHPARRGEADPDRRLLHEARVAASFRHPGVIRILDVVRELRAIVMECLAGSVKDRIRSPVSTEEALALSRGALEVAALLHARDVVHRDLKSSNLLLRADGRVVVADFGVARVGDEDLETGVVGTAGYVAPEVAAGRAATPASDVHALGVILGEIAGADLADPRRRALAALAESMRATRPDLRPDAAGALDRLRTASAR